MHRAPKGVACRQKQTNAVQIQRLVDLCRPARVGVPTTPGHLSLVLVKHLIHHVSGPFGSVLRQMCGHAGLT